MRHFPVLLLASLGLGPSVFAVTATGLSSFEGMEQPSERYDLATRTLEKESYRAISDLGNGTFRMALRYGPSGWDGDRDTGNRDRQRAEVKGLGPHQKVGETFEYATTWRVDAGFRGTTRFFHVFQVKATEGDDGAPLITMTLEHDPNRVSVRYWSGKDRASHVARDFRCMPGEWETVRIRVKTSFSADGEVLVSVNGDPFVGVTNLPIYRTDARDYRPKWGMYRGVAAGMSLTNDYVEHREVSANRLEAPPVENAALESEARARAANSIVDAIEWLEAQPAREATTEALGAVGVLWEEQAPAAALDWSLSAKVGADRSRLILRLYDHWQTRDIASAFAWITARAPNADLDPSLWYQATDTSFRHQLKGADLARAASLLSDPATRLKALSQALGRWVREPGGIPKADYFIEGLDVLSITEKKALRDRIDPQTRAAAPRGHEAVDE